MVLKQKKGLVFTIVALVISSFLLLMFFYMLELPVDSEVEVTNIKVRTANNFLSQVEDLAKAQAVASSQSAINEFLRAMYDENEFMDDFDNSFRRCLEEGSYSFDGDLSSAMYCQSESFFSEKIEENLSSFVKSNLGLDAVLSVDNVVLSQISPWELEVSFDMNVELMKEGFYWNISSDLSKSFFIFDLKDPVQTVVDTSLIDYRPDFDDITVISRNDMFNNISDDWVEKPSTLNIISQNKEYLENGTYGISYIDRLRGNMTLSEFGIFRIQLPIYDGSNRIFGGDNDIDWVFWQDETFGVATGKYDFIEQSDKILVLGLESPFDLNNTLHNAIVPVALAESANVSDASYFDASISESPVPPSIENFYFDVPPSFLDLIIRVEGDIDSIENANLKNLNTVTNQNPNSIQYSDNHYDLIWYQNDFTEKIYELGETDEVKLVLSLEYTDSTGQQAKDLEYIYKT